MSGPTGFFLGAAALLVVVLAILLRPLLRRHKPSDTIDRRQANLDILRDELRELEGNRAEGSLSESDFEQARRELQRRLLEEVEPAGKTVEAVRSSGGKRTAIALLIALPLAAAGGYALLGNQQALDPMLTQARMSPQEIDGLLQRLVDRLKANPDDTKGWIVLARSYKALGRFAESAEAFAHAGSALDSEASLLADYADALAQANGGRFDGKPDELIARALKLDPNDPQTLFTAGAAASERQDFAAVADYWGRLLLQVEPGSEDARFLEAAVNKAQEALGTRGGKAPGKTPAPLASGKAITGEVILGGKLAAQAKPDDTVFIFARTADGSSRMPLSVLRIRVADLPYRFRLDDSNGMPGGQRLSEAPAVILEARIAKAGMAQPSSGDMFGVVEAAKVGSQGVRLVIDQVQP
ncbi:MAG: c-type cytochrome biogenesis protein CcmI [Propionivibrio sp.]